MCWALPSPGVRRFLAETQHELKDRFGIGHTTLQIEIHAPGPHEHGPDCPLVDEKHSHGESHLAP
jgi:cobalt-zinc-cadmium efflux system protein